MDSAAHGPQRRRSWVRRGSGFIRSCCVTPGWCSREKATFTRNKTFPLHLLHAFQILTSSCQVQPQVGAASAKKITELHTNMGAHSSYTSSITLSVAPLYFICGQDKYFISNLNKSPVCSWASTKKPNNVNIRWPPLCSECKAKEFKLKAQFCPNNDFNLNSKQKKKEQEIVHIKKRTNPHQ